MWKKITVLGFVIQNNLEWESHIKMQCSKIYNSLRVLRLTSRNLPISIKLSLFKSLILPHFLYGDVFLLNASSMAINRLRVALNSCVRYIFNLSRYSRVSHLQHQLLGCQFCDFYKLRSCITLFKIISKASPEYLHDKLNPFLSNRNRNYQLQRIFTTHYRNTLFVQGIIFWNQLPIEIKNKTSLGGFRQDCIAFFSGQRQL